MIFSVVKIRFGTKGTKAHWGNPLQIFLFHIKFVGDIFFFVKKC